MDVPKKHELVTGDSLDEHYVLKNFLGKTGDDAYGMYFSQPNCTEDLMWMTLLGLEYYLPPAVRYVEGADSKGDHFFVSGLLSALSFRAAHETLTPQLRSLFRRLLEFVRANVDKFMEEDVDRYTILPHIQKIIAETEIYLTRQGSGR